MSARLPLSCPQRIIWTTEERQPGTAISTLAGVLDRPPVVAPSSAVFPVSAMEAPEAVLVCGRTAGGRT